MIKSLLILVFLGFIGGKSINAGDDMPLDFSQLHCDPKLVELIAANIPPEIERELAASGLVPTALNYHIVADFFPINTEDTSQTTAVIYYSDGARNQTLQVFRYTSDSWKLADATNLVIGESWLSVRGIDIDCDDINEIILGSATGAAGFHSLEVVKFDGDILRVITPQGTGNYIVGRYPKLIDAPDGCGKVIEVELDGPVKYQTDRKRIYKLDPVSKTYKFYSEEKLETRKIE